MRLLSAVAALVAGLVASSAAAEGVLVVKSRKHPAYERAVAAFTEKLGRAPVAVLEISGGSAERAALVDRAMAAKPDLVFAVGTLAAKLMADGLPEVPLVYCLVERPEEAGLPASRATGVSLEVPVKDQLELVKRALPEAKRVGVVYTRRQADAEVKAAKAVAPSLGLAVVAEEVLGTGDVPAALAKLAPEVDVLWVLADTTVLHGGTFALMLETSFARKLPIATFSEDLVARGALLGLGVDPAGSGARGAELARALLAGKKLAEVPPVPPAAEVSVNRSTMKRLGVALPASVLQDATLKD